VRRRGRAAGRPLDVLVPKVALATCAEIPEGDEEAPPLIEALAARGVEATPAVWDDPAQDWARYDLVVIRSTWDYPDRRDEFLRWADSLPFVLNPADVLRWNTHKQYLGYLGIDAVPTRLVPPGAPFEPPEAPFVVKPAVGVGSIGVARYDAGDERATAHVADLHAAGKTVLVQPYMEAVDEQGETTLMYVADEFSHALRKEPLLAPGAAPGAGLYLEERLRATEPSADERALAERALAALPFPRSRLLYARIDLLPGPVVLEVELTEPSLFIGYAEDAPERFADAIVAASQRRRMSAENGPTTSQ
jgi:glutathione synthase/RimK-type ligase-like ATP-grasp enzyme